MCGICGYISTERIGLEALKQMNDTMIHRGPDDSGACELVIEGGGKILGLAQRRLSIVDLSLSGHQPMHSKDGRLSLVYNGEIYNYPELKEELKNYPFCSQCDTEVIMASYLNWGIDCVKHFQGMFAIALYDKKEETFFLIRDRIGKKPLYYWQGENHFVFASELKPVMKYPYFEKKINEAVIPRFLFHQYISEPDSIFKDVFKLEPGTILSYCRGKVEKQTYFTIPDFREEQNKKLVSEADYPEAREELKRRLTDAVAKRLEADVNVGIFLSGGYDSALIAALASRNCGKTAKTFSIGFSESEWNEADDARKISEHLGTEHHERFFEESDILRLVENIPQYYDEPFADASQLPTMLLAENAVKEITVALSGDGADEFFGGYQHYETVAWAQKNKDRCQRLLVDSNSLDNAPFYMKSIALNSDPRFQVQFGSHNYLRAIEAVTSQTLIPCRYDETILKEDDWRIRRMMLDQIHYLPSVLCKVDRASMRSALEVRCPYLDTEVIEYAWRIPQQFKNWNGKNKIILKSICHDYIPENMMNRKKKGFTVPLDKWLRNQLKEQLLTYSRSDFLKRQGIFVPENMQQYVDWYLKNGNIGIGSNHSRVIWPFFVFQKWYDTYIQKL